MQNYKTNLTEGIYLEDLNTFIKWETDKGNLKMLLQKYPFDISENTKFNYYGVSVKSRFLNSNSVALITFNFVKEKLKSINISFPLYENDLEKSFEVTQHFLEEKLGRPKDLSLFNAQEKKFKWKFKNIVVTHEMFESFSWRETLEISVR